MDGFIRDFCQIVGATFEGNPEEAFDDLIAKYPASRMYMSTWVRPRLQSIALQYIVRKGVFTSGMSTTSRSESANSSVKHFLESTHSLCELYVGCKSWLRRVFARAADHEINLALKPVVEYNPPILASAAEGLNRHAMELFAKNYSMASSYDYEPLENGKFEVRT